MKKTRVIVLGAAATLLVVAVIGAKMDSFTPGSRTLILSHNAYPDHGKFENRLNRAIAVGLPFATEQDLSWVDGKSLEIHGARNVSSGDPTLDSYFIPRVKPIVQKALQEGNHGNWPLIVLFLDIKNDPPEHMAAINQWLDQYDGWLTTAVKTSDIHQQSPLDLKPMMVMVEDKVDDPYKQQAFYDSLPVGGKIRVFGTPPKFDENPNQLPKDRKAEALDSLVNCEPEQLLHHRADNYHRWFGINWAFIEKGGQARAGEWTKASEARLQKFVEYGHRLGYFVWFYALDGYTEAENQGWDKDYNFGSKEKVMPRWQALVRARPDFIATDQMEDLAAVLKAGR